MIGVMHALEGQWRCKARPNCGACCTQQASAFRRPRGRMPKGAAQKVTLGRFWPKRVCWQLLLPSDGRTTTSKARDSTSV